MVFDFYDKGLNYKRYEKIILVSLIFMIAVIPLVYLPFQGDEPNWERIGFYEYVIMTKDNIYKPKLNLLLFFTIFLLIYFLYLLKNKRIKINYNYSYFPLSLFTSLLIISTIFSRYKWIAIYGRPYRWEGLLAYTAYILFFFYISIFIDNKNKFSILLNSFLMSGGLISIYGLMQLFKLDFIKHDPIRERFYPRMFSTLGNPNFAGSYISMLLPLVLVLFFYARDHKAYLKIGFFSSLYYAFLIGTSTRGAWLTFFLLFPIICWVLRKRIIMNYKPLLVLLITFILITIAVDFYQGGYISRRVLSIFLDMEILLSESNIDTVGSNRMFIYKNTIPLLWKYPLFGSGLDTMARVFPQSKFINFVGRTLIVDKAHCEYLQLGVTAGIPALLAYLWFIISILKKGYSNLRKRNKYQQALFMAALAYVIQATFNISVVSVAPVFWAVLGMNVVINRLIVKEEGFSGGLE